MPANLNGKLSMHATTREMFESWRRGDAAAGQAMAQRFTDWYFAISANHSGEQQGRQGFQAACDRFSKGISAVPDPRRLGPWAQTVAKDLIHAGRPPLDDGDYPGSYTANQAPKALLAAARQAHPETVQLLEMTYRGGHVADPHAVLKARYALKHWLAKEHQVPFRYLPSQPDPDLIPIPFYEAARMKAPQEVALLELFLLDEPDLIQDVAEFAHFAIALRGGLDGAGHAAHAPMGSSQPRATVVPGSQRTHSGLTGPGTDGAPTEPAPRSPPAPMSAPPQASANNDLARFVPVLAGLVVVLLLLVAGLMYMVLT